MTEAEERLKYPNLPANVSIHHCTKESPMKIKGDDAVKLDQLWIHDDAEETKDSLDMDGTIIDVLCPHCNHRYSCYVGD